MSTSRHRHPGRFANRRAAGWALAAALVDTGPAGESTAPVVVLALPRGGVPVAAEVARALDAPLDVLLVRKLGLPGQPEFAMGAIGEGGVRVLDADLVQRLGVTGEQVAAVESAERAELARRSARYRHGRPPLDLRGRTALIVDDGLATGATARASCLVARSLGAAIVVLAAPVGPQGIARELADVADHVLVLHQPASFTAVGAHYDDFTQTTDDEVQAALDAAAR